MPFSLDDESFGSYPTSSASLSETRDEITLWQEHNVTIGTWQVLAQGLGGWTVDVHHTYSPVSRSLHLGNGTRQSGDLSNPVLGVVLLRFAPRAITAAPDGSLYFIEDCQLKRMDDDGAITLIAGQESPGFGGDGGPASAASFYRPNGIDIAADGSIYIADTGNHRIRRIGPDGVISTVAGTGSIGLSGDGGLATEADLAHPSDVAVAPTGGFYISQGRYAVNEALRYVAPDGTITTAAGQNGISGTLGDGGPAADAYVEPRAVALGPDGSLYLMEWQHRIRRIAPDGIITTVAGTGVSGFSGDGGPAIAAQIATGGDNASLHVAQDGSIYFPDISNHRLRWVDTEGIIHTIAGSGANGYPSDGQPATLPGLSFYDFGDVTVDRAGQIHFTMDERICTIKAPLEHLASGEWVYPSRDGREIYIFAPGGRHLRTVDALTGSTRYEFGYDAAGLLVSITDGASKVTTFERGTDGDLVAISGPYGHRTAVTLDGDGYLHTVTDPLGGSWTLGYGLGGLLSTFTDPNGATLTYAYDDEGLLLRDDDPESGFLALERAETEDGFEVPVLSAEDRSTTYAVETLEGDVVRRTTTFPDGTQNIIESYSSGEAWFWSADGMLRTSRQGPDPRYGMLLPFVQAYTETTPGGITLTYSQTKTATLDAAGDVLRPVVLEAVQTLNGLAFRNRYYRGDRTITRTTAEGRQLVTVLDDLGRPVEYRLPGLASLFLAYDADGRLQEIRHGSGAEARTYTAVYDATSGALTQLVNPLGLASVFSRDALGRITGITSPAGDHLALGFDGRGNLLSLTPPGRSAHSFGYNQVNRLTTYDPPNAGTSTSPWALTYNRDRQLTAITNSGDRTVTFAYDAAGRLESAALDRGTLLYQYDPLTGKLVHVTTPDGGYDLEYDGKLVTGMAWTGAVSGQVGLAYDNFFQLSSCTVNGSDPIAFTYDNDGLLTGAGDLTLLHGVSGLVAQTNLGGVTDTWGYNTFGDLTAYSYAYGGSQQLAIALTRDALGRVAAKEETLGGVTTTLGYGYADSGRLETVTRNGVQTDAYTYDGNGNRLSHTAAGTTIAATYDDQDRLLSFGSPTFTYRDDGSLASKTEGAATTTYLYDELGQLTAATLPDGTAVTYLIDGRNRRIGKRVDGTLVQGLLYSNRLNPAAELDGSGTVVSRFVYGTRGNVPDYMVRGGQTYRIIADPVGSPRFVVNTATGTVAQQIEYDPFGKPTFRVGAPDFQPFGFAGGLYDADTGLVRFGTRDYDPGSGRFTAKDPVLFEGGSANLYAYLDNDPVNRVDASGMGGGSDCDDDGGDCNGRNGDRDDEGDGNDSGEPRFRVEASWRESAISFSIPGWADSVIGLTGAVLGTAMTDAALGISTTLAGSSAALGLIAYPVAFEGARQTADQLAEVLIEDRVNREMDLLDALQENGERGVHNPNRDDRRDPCP